MKLTKQTVYLPVKVEDASGNYIPDKSVLIVKEQGELDKYWDDLVKPQEGYFFTLEQLNEYTQKVIKQALETAAENIEFIETTTEKLNSEEYKPFITADDNTVWTIDKQSITNTFEETFKLFKHE